MSINDPQNKINWIEVYEAMTPAERKFVKTAAIKRDITEREVILDLVAAGKKEHLAQEVARLDAMQARQVARFSIVKN